VNLLLAAGMTFLNRFNLQDFTISREIIGLVLGELKQIHIFCRGEEPFLIYFQSKTFITNEKFI
jgi:hypothetical protein